MFSKNNKVNHIEPSTRKQSSVPGRGNGRRIDSYTAAGTHRRREVVTNTNYGLIATLIMLFILALVAVILIVVQPWSTAPVESPSAITTAETQKTAETQDPLIIPEGLDCDYRAYLSASYDEGYLILINIDHPYNIHKYPDLVKITKANKGKLIDWAGDHMLETKVLKQLSALSEAYYKATGLSNILLNSTYRSYEDQLKVYEQYGPEIAIIAGCSEHHTGLAVDMQIYDKNYAKKMGYETSKTAWYFTEYEAAQFLVEHFAEYGFVLRYPEDKTMFTHIPTYEPWHYRYVGVPHASIMDHREECLEEYLDYLHTLSFDGKRLMYQDGEISEVDYLTIPSSGFLIYYVPKSNEIYTNIPILKSATSYEISGDNVNGFIITLCFN